MLSDPNVQAWLNRAPKEITAITERLLSQVAQLRASETIYPAQENILKALSCTAPQEVRAVILGQDPYHGPNQAMGLAFSVPKGQKLPPSLRNIYKELASDLGCPMPQSGDLTAWAERGVLLLNTSLTVRAHAAGSHARLGWQDLTTYVIQTCAQLPQPVVFLAWGRNAVEMIELTLHAQGNPDNKVCLASTHPSPLSANRATQVLPAFIGSKPFSRANEELTRLGAQPIDWACLE
ncbi:MAG: uracil-DNA glycosylase [Coriobacteriales bacterium]|nr:uracil-DNA glycosylase [Coriobacteriales bacterium]